MKIIKIQSCGDACPYFVLAYTPEIVDHCSYNGENIVFTDSQDFPNTCPLEEE